MMPVETVTMRMRLLVVSAMYTFPVVVCTKTPRGLLSCDWVACTLSAPKPEIPFALPAMVVIVPEASTLRTWWSVVTAMYTTPVVGCTSTSFGAFRNVLVAAIPLSTWPPPPA